MWQQLLEQLVNGNTKALARSISLVENEREGYEALLQHLPVNNQARIIGVTGPPGAGKSTLVDGMIGELIHKGHKVAVLCVDPSSPFNMGAVLGDRIRMSRWYTHERVFIRSLASRGSVGGLHPKIIEVTDLVKAAGYHYLILETVGVGQSEIEIAGLADTTVVVMVPESGDEIQTMKAGLMEIADVFVVNKSDRPGADAFAKNLRMMLAPAFSRQDTAPAIINTIASERKGLPELMEAIAKQEQMERTTDRRYWLLAERAYKLIQDRRMKDITRAQLAEVLKQTDLSSFNLYRFALQFS